MSTRSDTAVYEHLLSGFQDEFWDHRWDWSNPWGESKDAERIGHMTAETVKGNFLFDLQDDCFSKSSLNPRALMSVVCFNVCEEKE